MTMGRGKIDGGILISPSLAKRNFFFYDDVMQGLFSILFSFLFL